MGGGGRQRDLDARVAESGRGSIARSVCAATAGAADAVSLLDPDRFYDDLLKPSLAALYVSQIIVFALFPRFRRGTGAIALAVVASGLAVWGLYELFWAGASTRDAYKRPAAAFPSVFSALSGLPTPVASKVNSVPCFQSSRVEAPPTEYASLPMPVM